MRDTKGTVWSGRQRNGRFRSDRKKFKKLRKTLKAQKQSDQVDKSRIKKVKRKIKDIRERRNTCRKIQRNLFKAANAILQEHCSSCHIQQHTEWKVFQTKDDWLQAEGGSGEKLIDEADLEHSLLLRRIIFYGSSSSTMPLSNDTHEDPFTESDYETLKEWVVSLKYAFPPSQGIGIRELSFDERGIVFDLDCENPTDSILVRVTSESDPSESPIYETSVSCGGRNSEALKILDEAFETLGSLVVSFFKNDQLLGEIKLQKTFSKYASCQIQGKLLPTTLRRLTQKQIQNAITDIFGNIFSNDVWPNMEDGFNLIGMSAMADRLNINSINLERLYDSVKKVVQTLLSEHPQISTCKDAETSDCIDTIIDEYGLLIWRRPLSTAEKNQLISTMSNFSTNDEKLEFLFHALLLHSNFLFRKELGVTSAEIRTLQNYELISLLSFTVWNSTPNRSLLDLASQDEPISYEQLLTKMEEMLQSPKAISALLEVYTEFLKLKLVLMREKDESFGFNQSVRETLLESAQSMIRHQLEQDPYFMSVFGGTRFYVNDQVEQFFNVDVEEASLLPIPLNSNQREGILNHPAFLATHATRKSSGIVKRGVFTLEQLLCYELGDPPEEISGVENPPNLDPETTSDRDLLQLTHSSQPACRGCHHAIDPAGFGFENFDAVGRYRTTEKKNVPIDASGVLDIGEYLLSFEDSADYSRELMNSPQMKQCFTRRLLEHYFGQRVELDDCEMRKLEQQIADSEGKLADLLLSVIGLESFRMRRAR